MDKKEWCVRHLAGILQGYTLNGSIGEAELFRLVGIIQSEINILKCRDLSDELGDLPKQMLLLQKELHQYNEKWMEAKLPVQKRYIDTSITLVKEKIWGIEKQINQIERKYQPVNFLQTAGPIA